MKLLYSAQPRRRALQLVADASAMVSIISFVVLSVMAGVLLNSLAALGRGIEDAGTWLRGTMTDAADSLGGIPLIGPGASSPFRSAGDAGTMLADAGQRQQQLIGEASLVVGIIVAVVPIIAILLLWLRPRIRFVRRAAQSRLLSQTAAGRDLLALRALVGFRPEALLSLAPDPVAAWRAGDPRTIGALSALELRQAGVLSD
ncbi:hypothetical protein B7R22_04160 [Subtercola boreus]|uniref:Uncharacterized protein n=1 Tax=Subtercola boreus TaxID=120213 RepID=A0A3E0W596_9MICO|nr:hypothetical protein [Subtercola boreus]RFA16668.1 hypothetical protein B7R22_04160 [Subtercola boreus]